MDVDADTSQPCRSMVLRMNRPSPKLGLDNEAEAHVDDGEHGE